MRTRIREVRRNRNLTLQQVAERCEPPTTAQTIGRLETGTRTVSVRWLNRIASALGVQAADLVQLPDIADMPIIATIDHEGAHLPRREAVAVMPRPEPGLVAVAVASSVGDYRSGDEVWLRRIGQADYGGAINRDVLVPRPGGRFLFGRLLDHDGERLLILPTGAGARQTVISDPEWLAVAVKLVRSL
ncbi:MAG: helix-turn-helix domain-containing protein [Sphingosinicella sp.]